MINHVGVAPPVPVVVEWFEGVYAKLVELGITDAHDKTECTICQDCLEARLGEKKFGNLIFPFRKGRSWAWRKRMESTVAPNRKQVCSRTSALLFVRSPRGARAEACVGKRRK